MAEKRGRKFAVVTYIQDTDKLLSRLLEKSNSIRSYAVIKHDKDETDIHHHVVLRTHSAWSCVRVAKWFDGVEEGQHTFAQFVHDDQGIIDYLTHKNCAGEKYVYDDSNIIDEGLSDLIPAEDSRDDTLSIIDDMLSGMSMRELVRRYGRDFVYHVTAYQYVVNIIRSEEN